MGESRDPLVPATPGTSRQAQETPDRVTSLATSRAWRGGRPVDFDVTPAETVAALDDPAMLVWIDLLEPSVSDLQAVIGSLGLPPTAVEDVLGPRERPKVVRHPDWVYVTTHAVVPHGIRDHSAGRDDPRVQTVAVSAIATISALVTIRLDPAWDMDEVQRRWDRGPGLEAHGVEALLHGLLDTIVDEQHDAIQELDEEAEALEDVLLDEQGGDDAFIRRIYGLRKDLSHLRRIIVPMRDIVADLHRRAQDADASMTPWWDDLRDHVVSAAEWMDSLHETVTTLTQTQMSLMDWKLNIVMKKLAGWAAIIAVPTLITGWFGQNIAFPGYGTWTGLVASTVLLGAASLGLYLAFRRRDWL